MAILQIADKPTLDVVDSDVTYIKNNLPSGGSSPILVIKNDNMDFTGIEFTISCGDFTDTVTMPDDDSVEIEVPYIGEYSISYSDDISITDTVNMSNVGKTLFIPSMISIPSFANATWEQIEQIVTAYYNGIISDLSEYWSIGDTKSVDLSSMSATGVGESHVVQTVQIAIAGFDIDTLTTSINEHTKAAITLTQVDCLKETGYINSSNTNTGSWDGSARRTWCNNVYYNALPSNLKSIIKQVHKTTIQTYNGSTNQTSADYCWLLAEREVFTSRVSSNQTEFNALSTYPYYNTSANRVKKVNGSADAWWGRSPRSSNSTGFCAVGSGGSAADGRASYSYGLAPCMCL